MLVARIAASLSVSRRRFDMREQRHGSAAVDAAGAEGDDTSLVPLMAD